MEKLQRDRILQSTHDESLEKFKSCTIGNMARKPFPHQVEIAKDLLRLIHINVCGPFRTVLREGASYFITFTDDFSHYGYVYLMKHKHEVFKTFKVFQNEVENQLSKKIKAIRSDLRREYLSHEFVNHMKSCGVVSQLTPPYTPQHNRVSERRSRTLLDMVRSMMNLTTLPKSFWGYALDSAARILYMVPTKKVERTLYEIRHGKAPKLSNLRVWGCEALVKRDTPNKLDPRSINCIFIGYPKETMGYYFYYPPKNKIFIARNAKFFENSLIVQEASGSHGILKMSERDLNEPPNYKAALSDPEYDKWLEAMNTEMKSMKDNEVWILVKQNPGEIHWTVVKTILKYLRNTKDVVLVYEAKPKAELKVSCYADASFQTDKDDTKSQTGYVFVLNDGFVNWKSAKQSTIAMSSTEAEYIVADGSSMDEEIS
uniref:Retrotransposon protein, putative, Ty1-copia subclass n=1 Tax=Tanacetum cinerariifolium TaxID=118510 RepID=A0A6L2NNP5_TANCI|nr:retrotransposon protein, putative, Ty1-copia subclass [Tanacetum cinerariifolium]